MNLVLSNVKQVYYVFMKNFEFKIFEQGFIIIFCAIIIMINICYRSESLHEQKNAYNSKYIKYKLIFKLFYVAYNS